MVAPIALYFYAVHPAWSWMYWFDPAKAGGVAGHLYPTHPGDLICDCVADPVTDPGVLDCVADPVPEAAPLSYIVELSP